MCTRGPTDGRAVKRASPRPVRRPRGGPSHASQSRPAPAGGGSKCSNWLGSAACVTRGQKPKASSSSSRRAGQRRSTLARFGHLPKAIRPRCWSVAGSVTEAKPAPMNAPKPMWWSATGPVGGSGRAPTAAARGEGAHLDYPSGGAHLDLPSGGARHDHDLPSGGAHLDHDRPSGGAHLDFPFRGRTARPRPPFGGRTTRPRPPFRERTPRPPFRARTTRPRPPFRARATRPRPPFRGRTTMAHHGTPQPPLQGAHDTSTSDLLRPWHTSDSLWVNPTHGDPVSESATPHSLRTHPGCSAGL